MILPLFLAFVEDAEDRELLIGYYSQHRFTLLNEALKVLHDPGLAEDAVQEAFIRFAKVIKRVRSDPKQVRSFLVTITKNVAKDMRGERDAVPLVSLDSIPYDPPDPIDVEELAVLRVEADVAEQIVQSLPSIYSGVFMLRYKYDCSDRDIATLLKISEATVRKRLQRSKTMVANEVQRREAKKKGGGSNA